MYTAWRLRQRGSGAFLASVRTGLVTAVCAGWFVSVLPSSLSSQEAVSPLAEALSNRLAAPGLGFSMAPALRFELELRRFYGERGYAPVWLSPTSRAGRLDELLAAFRSADRDGLRSDEYGAADVAFVGGVTARDVEFLARREDRLDRGLPRFFVQRTVAVGPHGREQSA